MTLRSRNKSGPGRYARRLLRSAAALTAAGAMVLSMCGMTAFAETTNTDVKEQYQLKLDLKVGEGGTDVPSGVSVNIYKVADLVKDAKGNYKWDFGDHTNPAELADGNALIEGLNGADGATILEKYDIVYAEGYADGGDGSTVPFERMSVGGKDEFASGETVTLPPGAYYVVQADTASVLTRTNVIRRYQTVNGTRYTLGTAIVSLPNDDADTDKDGVVEIHPKSVSVSRTIPGGPPPGGPGGPPPTNNRRVPPPEDPPSEGSVLGASRDNIEPPQVLGANRLPRTGQLWWPVPVLDVLGMAMIAVGVMKRRKSARA